MGGGGSVSFRGASPPIHPPLRSPPSLPSRGEEGWGEGILSSLGGDPIPSLPCQSVLRPPSPMTGPGKGGGGGISPALCSPFRLVSRHVFVHPASVQLTGFSLPSSPFPSRIWIPSPHPRLRRAFIQSREDGGSNYDTMDLMQDGHQESHRRRLEEVQDGHQGCLRLPASSSSSEEEEEDEWSRRREQKARKERAYEANPAARGRHSDAQEGRGGVSFVVERRHRRRRTIERAGGGEEGAGRERSDEGKRGGGREPPGAGGRACSPVASRIVGSNARGSRTRSRETKRE